MSPALLGSTYVVPDDQPSIQAAIDSSASGDTILVRAGTYYENLQTLGKSLTLRSLGSSKSTIIDGNRQGSVISVTATANTKVRIEGFTIQNGLNNNGGGIFVEGDGSHDLTVTIIANIITNNTAYWGGDLGIGGGIYLEFNSAGSLIDQNILDHNYAADSGGGLAGSHSRISRNIFRGNGCHVGGGGLLSGAGNVVTENLITENWSDSFGGGIDGGADLISGNTIVGNYINNGSFAQGAGLSIYGGSVIERNIIALNHGPAGRGTGIGLRCSSSDGIVAVQCNDLWSNDLDYVSGGGCDTTGLGNFSDDPMFCDSQIGNFTLNAASRCAPGNNSCGLIGAYMVACGTVSIRETTWGRIKSLYGLTEKQRGGTTR